MLNYLKMIYLLFVYSKLKLQNMQCKHNLLFLEEIG
jgi:hypothetical protein